jgi:hypothetical protein
MDFVFILVLIVLANQVLIGSLSRKHTFLSKKLLNGVFLYHLMFLGAYYTYALFNASDSLEYYKSAVLIGSEWQLFEYTGTDFVDNFAAIFVQYGLSYPAMMLLFSWFGYIGFVYAYLFIRENIPIDVKVFGRFDLLKLLLFLPNMHFWTVSLGKGSLIFMGLMIFTYAVRFPQKRLVALLVGGFFIYMIRPAVMFFVLVGVLVGVLTGRERLSPAIRLLVIVAAVGFLYAAQSTILGVANLQNSENMVADFQEFSDAQSDRLMSSGSGVAMNSYPLPLKLFTFWFRPLFVDSPGALGLFSSAENLLYLLLFLKICNKRFLRFFRTAPYMVKMCAVTFFTASYAMTFVMSNLGIMMRQKSMVMYFLFFVIYYFLADEKWQNMQLEHETVAVN